LSLLMKSQRTLLSAMMQTIRPEGVANAAASATFRTSVVPVLAAAAVVAGAELEAPLGRDSEMLTVGTVEAESPDDWALGADPVGEDFSPMRLQAVMTGTTPTTRSTCFRERMDQAWGVEGPGGGHPLEDPVRLARHEEPVARRLVLAGDPGRGAVAPERVDEECRAVREGR